MVSGLALRPECCNLAPSRHMRFSDLSDIEFMPGPQRHVAALNPQLVIHGPLLRMSDLRIKEHRANI